MSHLIFINESPNDPVTADSRVDSKKLSTPLQRDAVLVRLRSAVTLTLLGQTMYERNFLI